MNKLYKLSGFGLTALTPLAIIACAPTSTESQPTNTYYETPVATTSTATIIFKNLEQFVGKTLAVQVKKRSETNWSQANRVGITTTSVKKLVVDFSDLEAGVAYDLKILIMQPGASSEVFKDLGTQNSAFTTTSITVPVVPDPEQPVDPVTPPVVEKPLAVETEIISPTNVHVHVLNVEKYLGKELSLNYKLVKNAEQLQVSDYFVLASRTTEKVILNFEADYLQAYAGKKLKLEYKKTIAPVAGETLPAEVVWTNNKIVDIPATINLIGLPIELTDVEASKYDLKLTILETDGTTLVKNLGAKNEAFEASATAVSTPSSRIQVAKMVVTAANASKLTFRLSNLTTNSLYHFGLETTGTSADNKVEILPFAAINSFNTANLAKVEKLVVADKITLKLSHLLAKYEGTLLTVALTKTSSATNNHSFIKHVLVENQAFNLTFTGLHPSSDYKIQISLGDGTDGGQLINLEGLDANDLTLSVPAVPTISLTATVGPSSIIVKGAGAIVYKGKNLVIKYAPKDAGATDALALDSQYALQTTATVQEDGSFELAMLNLTKINASEAANVERAYVYQITLESSNLFVTSTQFNTASTTKFVAVKIAKTEIADNTIQYAGSSVNVTITNLEAYKGKELEIRAVPNPDTTREYIANYFPIDATHVRSSMAVAVPATADATAGFDTTFKILNLDSALWYVFQVFLKGEKNPLLPKGYDFLSNVSPNSEESLVSKNSIKVKVSRLANSIGGEIQLKYANNSSELNGDDSTKIHALTAITITNDNKDNVEFTIPTITGTSIVYKLEIKSLNETTFSEAKEVVVILPTSSATSIVGGMEVKLINAQMLVGKKVHLRYKRSDAVAATAMTEGTAEVVVAPDGSVTIIASGLESGEFYTYTIWTKDTTPIEVLNTDDNTRKVQTLSTPIADVLYGNDHTAITANVQSLYGLVGHSLKLQYRKTAASGLQASPWIDWTTKAVVEVGKEKDGIVFNLTGLEADQKYEFQVIDETANKVIINPMAFQYTTTS